MNMKVFAILFFLLVFPNCEIFEEQQGPKPRVIDIELDISGSYSVREVAKQAVFATIDECRDGDIVRIGMICDESFSAIAQTFLIPATRAFDKKARERQEAVKREIKECITKVLKQQSNRTDIWGSLHAASIFLSRFDGVEKEVLMFTDLKDTETKRNGRLNLQNVAVRVMGFPRPKDIQEYYTIKELWRKHFTEARCKSFEIYHADEIHLTTITKKESES